MRARAADWQRRGAVEGQRIGGGLAAGVGRRVWVRVWDEGRGESGAGEPGRGQARFVVHAAAASAAPAPAERALRGEGGSH